MNEAFYISGLARGDHRIFRDIFDQYNARLCYFAASLLPSEEQAEDVVQEAFVQLWQRRTGFSSLQAVKNFLYVAVRNRCLNVSRHHQVVQKYTRTAPAGYEDVDVSMKVVEAEIIEGVYSALQKLPKGCRTVLHLSYFQGLRNKDIAAQMGVSINTVKTQKKRGLHLLRTMLKTVTCWLF